MSSVRQLNFPTLNEVRCRYQYRSLGFCHHSGLEWEAFRLNMYIGP